jgi:2-amino-4-hydroxy-6-hydroxymethyldihydropteridine diphosphokinase
MNDIYLLTGGNMGDRLYNLEIAEAMIERTAGPIIKRSSIYETAAWGFTEQNAFLNQVLCITSHLNAVELLQQLLSIELELGRKRVQKMGPRGIDIDILFYGQQIISTPDLVVPHPRIAERRFVLTPLNEIAPDFIHPVYQKTVQQLLKICADPLEVKLYKTYE